MSGPRPDELALAPVAGLQRVRLLGRGGEGEVWEAVRVDGSRCALKLVRPEVLATPDEVRRRGRWLMRIDHPHLVRVHRGGRILKGELDGWGFVEMELVEGPSLAAAPPDPRALEALAPVAEALDLLHAGTWSDGIPLIHRDVKPANLVAAAHGLVLVDPSTLRGLDATELTRVGTPAYAAPEVHSGRFGPPVDVYALAVTAIALASGARGRDLVDLVARADDLGLPPGVRAALDPDPSRRPATCGDVVDGDAPAIATTAGRAHPGRVAASGAPARRAPAVEPPELALTAGRWWCVLAVLVLVPLGAWATGAADERLLLALAAGAAAGHLLAHLAAGRRPLLALLAPPAAWGVLLAERSARRPTRVAWVRAAVTGWLLAGGVGALVAHFDAAQGRPWAAAGVAGAGVLGSGLAVAGARLRGIGAFLLRVTSLPAWLAGAVVVLAAAPFAMVAAAVGFPADERGWAARTVASAVEVLRGAERRTVDPGRVV